MPNQPCLYLQWPVIYEGTHCTKWATHSHFMLVSQTSAGKSSSCRLLPVATKKKNAHKQSFFSQNHCCDLSERNKEELPGGWLSLNSFQRQLHLLSHLFTPLQRGYETWHNKLHHVSFCYVCGKSQLLVMSFQIQIYRSTPNCIMGADVCGYVFLRKRLSMERKVISLPFKMNSCGCEEERRRLKCDFSCCHAYYTLCLDSTGITCATFKYYCVAMCQGLSLTYTWTFLCQGIIPQPRRSS